MILRGVIRGVDDQPKCQTVQVSARAGEDLEGERFQEFGLSTVPPVGTEAIAVQIAGTYDSEVIVATESREHRPRNMASGDVVLYDSRGNQILLVSSGILLGDGATAGVGRVGDEVRVTIPAGTVVVGVTGGGGTPAVAVMNPADIVLVGSITAGSGTVKAVD